MLDSLTLPSGDAEAGDIEATPCCRMYTCASSNCLRMCVMDSQWRCFLLSGVCSQQSAPARAQRVECEDKVKGRSSWRISCIGSQQLCGRTSRTSRWSVVMSLQALSKEFASFFSLGASLPAQVDPVEHAGA